MVGKGRQLKFSQLSWKTFSPTLFSSGMTLLSGKKKSPFCHRFFLFRLINSACTLESPGECYPYQLNENLWGERRGVDYIPTGFKAPQVILRYSQA